MKRLLIASLALAATLFLCPAIAQTPSISPLLPPKPQVRTTPCPTGYKGKFTQTQAYVRHTPPPPFWVPSGVWFPVDPPAGACESLSPPPSGKLTTDLSYVNQSSQTFAKFKAYVDRAVAGHPDYLFSATDAAYMFKITGGAQYAALALSMIDGQVNAANAAIAGGGTPAVAGDSYLQAGPMIGDLALVYAWCNPSAAERAAWTPYAAQTIFNIWHHTQAAWGGHPASWSGWAVDDPLNNYYYSFLTATMTWALATNDATLLAFLRTDRLQLLTNAYAAIAGGGSLEGTGYGTSHMVLFWLYQVWKDSTGEDLANVNTHLTNSIEFWVHATMPTLDRFDPFGDQARVSEPLIYDYQRRLELEGVHLTRSADAARDGSYWLGVINNGGAGVDQMQSSFNLRYNLIPHATITTPPASLNFRAPEVGLITGRTSWTPTATKLSVLMGLYNQSHAHQEQGGFTLFNGTWLAVTNNIWSHSGINQSTIDKNVVRIEKNGAVQPQHQCSACKVNVTSYTTGAGGNFHVVGDITPLYQASEGVTSWVRTVDFNAGVATIHDALALAAGTTATFQVNVPVEPTISGNVVTAGGLKMTVLAPANPTISKLDMRTVNVPGYGFDFNKGWRIDVAGAATYDVKLEPQATRAH